MAQNGVFQNYNNLTISDGLSDNGVTCMLEDSKGFLWFGTYSGINRYDGYKVVPFKNVNKSKILINNRVQSLAEDKNGNIWIGTERGITIFDTSKKKFKNLEILVKDSLEIFKNRNVHKLIVSKEKNTIVSISETRGVQLFADNFELLGEYLLKKDLLKSNIKITDAILLNETHVLITTNIGLIDFDLMSKKFTYILQKEVKYCASVSRVDNDKLLVAFDRGIGLVSYDLFENLISYKLKEVFLKKQRIAATAIDDFGGLWLGTQRTGVVYIKSHKTFLEKGEVKMKHFKNGTDLLVSSKLFVGANNICWYGTFNSGVFKFNTKENSFVNGNLAGNENKVYNVEEIGDSKIVISRGYKMISGFNLASNQHEELPSKLLKNTNYFFLDSKGDYWANEPRKSFFRLKKNSNKPEEIKIESSDPKDVINKTRFIAEEINKEARFIWVGARSTLYRISLGKDDAIEKVESLNDNPFFKRKYISEIRFIYQDPIYNFMWVGTDNKGLYRLNTANSTSIETIEIDQYIPNLEDEFSIPSFFVSSVLRLPNDELWIGTEGSGACKVEDSQGMARFIPFTEAQGLSNNVVKSMVSDADSNLWLATNFGLNKLDTKSFKVTKFGKYDGLPFDDFYYGSKTMKNGTIVLTGQNGLCYFNPKDIFTSEKLPRVEFEKFKIFDKLVEVDDVVGDRVVLEKSITEIDEINLRYDENVFSIDVLSLHYSNPENHLLKYKLEPVNKSWVEVASNQNTITYSGLQPGNYALQVSVSNSLGEWSVPREIKITVHPPIWKTSWAYVGYLFLVLGIGYLIIRIVLKIHLLNHKIEIEQLEKDNAKDINEAKFSFFANISHEIKTPLTLISNPINNLYERFHKNPDLGEKLGMVLRQSKKIHELIEQVQDFRRSDANMLKMNYSRFEFNSFINDLVNDFMYTAYSDKKELKLIGDELPIIVSADKNKLEKIVNNLLNNAFKYTKENDLIKVSYYYEDKDLILSIEDTGRGIDAIDVAHVFERFYQSHLPDNKHLGGSGIGLAFAKRLVEMHYGYISVKSELGRGSKFTVKLPIIKAHTAEDKLGTEDLVLPQEKEFSVNAIQNNEEWSKIKASGEFSESLIFYAEDNDEMRNYITRFLSQFFKVKSFRNGKECLEAFDNEWPDLVVSDVQMPELNGLDLCIRIKSDLKTSHIPIILLTALTNLKDHLQGIKDGADAYIKKPFNLEQLLATVEARLNNRKQLRERFQIGIPLTRDNKNSRNDNAFLEKFYSLIDENLDNQDFDLKTLASELCLSKSAFYQKVNTLTNQTPFELIKNYRLKKATELLCQENLSVTQVFLMTGFKSRSHFSTKFKEKYKVTPGKYVSQIRADNIK